MADVPETSTPALRFDVIAGLTAAAVVLPKAMAYATVAGLPVSVGLYTAFVPMIVYALLGTSRVLSVSSTTTLAILTGAELGLVVPDGDPGKLITATATLTALTGALLVGASLLRLGFVANFISTPGAHRIQGRHRNSHRARSDSEAARHPHHQGGLFPGHPEHGASCSRDVPDHLDHRRRGAAGIAGHGADVAALAGAAGRGWRWELPHRGCSA